MNANNPRNRREDPLRWQVMRERFQWPDSDPPAGEPQGSIGDILADLFRRIDVRRQPALLDTIRAAWPEIAGPAVTVHARPGYLDRQVLTVFVDSATWLHELARFERPRLLRDLQARFGPAAIRDVRLQHDPEPPPAGR